MTYYTLPLDFFPVLDTGYALVKKGSMIKGDRTRYEIISLGAGGGVRNSAFSKSYILKKWEALKAEFTDH